MQVSQQTRWSLVTSPPRPLWIVPPDRAQQSPQTPPPPGAYHARGPKPDLSTTTPLQPKENFFRRIWSRGILGQVTPCARDCARGGLGGTVRGDGKNLWGGGGGSDPAQKLEG